MSVESVLVADPEVIISSGVSTVRPDWLDNWNHWPSLTAVSKQSLFFIPPDLVQRQTPRALVGAKEMCGYIDKARENLITVITNVVTMASGINVSEKYSLSFKVLETFV